MCLRKIIKKIEKRIAISIYCINLPISMFKTAALVQGETRTCNKKFLSKHTMTQGKGLPKNLNIF